MPEVKPEEMVHHPPMDQLQEFEYYIDSNPSWGEAITLGFQHYILSLGTAVMIPTMLVPLVGGNDKCKRVDPLSLRTVNGALPCIPVSDISLLTLVTVPIIRDANIKNDTSNYETKITLWGQRATEFDADSVYEADQIKPVTALFVGVLMKRY